MKQLAETNPTQMPIGTHPFHFERTWKLMRADKNIYRDVLHKGSGTVLELRMNKDTGVVTAVGEPPPAFVESQLELRGSVQPDLDAAGVGDALNPYDVNRDEDYLETLDKLIKYFQEDKEGDDKLARLEGVITMHCCWPVEGSRLAELNPDPHYVKTDMRLYLFEEGMKDGLDATSSRSPLLVLWAPDSPRLPINPDGSAIGNP